jgi:hypothetical protein
MVSTSERQPARTGSQYDDIHKQHSHGCEHHRAWSSALSVARPFCGGNVTLTVTINGNNVVNAAIYSIRRIVIAEDGTVISDERVKRDPVLTFHQPAPVAVIDSGVGTVTVELRSRDFDGEERRDSGTLSLRLRGSRHLGG